MSAGLRARCPLAAEVRKLVSKLRSSQPVNAQGFQLSVAVTVLKVSQQRSWRISGRAWISAPITGFDILVQCLIYVPNKDRVPSRIWPFVVYFATLTRK